MSEKMDIGFLIPTIANELKKKANLVLKDYGITVKQGRFLGYLHENKGIETSQKDLQEHFEISHPTTVGIIKRLEQKHLITTRFDEINRRNKIVELAPAEKKINTRMLSFKGELERDLLKSLSPDECTHLRELLMIVHHNIKNQGKYNGN